MRKKFTLFLAVCMLAATSVSAATVKDTDKKAEATKEVKEEKKADDKEEAKDEKKADDKEEAKDEKKANDKEEVKDEKKADDKEEAKDEKKADDKEEVKDEKKADDKEEAKDEKKADDKEEAKKLTKEELEAKLKDLKQTGAVKVVNDAYKALEKLFAEHESSSEIADYFALKADYATKEKVQAFLEKSFSAKYVESFLKLDGKFKIKDEKCYVKVGALLTKCDFSKATLKSKEVKDDTAVLFFETIDNNDEKTTYKATFVYEADAWKVDALTYETQRGLKGNVLI